MGKRSSQQQELIRELQDHVARLRLDVRRGRSRAFDAAQSGRRTENWIISGGGPNADIIRALATLRRRSQDLVDNNPWASRAVTVIVNNWVGAAGIVGQPKGGSRGRRDAWSRWSRSTACDWHGVHDMAGLQQLWARTIAVRGSVLIRRRIVPELSSEGLPGVQLETLEPDMLDTSKRGTGIIGGIQYRDDGRIAGYHILKSHPLDGGLLKSTTNESVYVARDDIAHVFDVRRPGQYDGVPWGAAAILRLRDLDDFESAELLKQKLAACFVAFVVDPDPETNADRLVDLDTLEPGAIEQLPPGHDVRFATPPSLDGFAAYVRQQLYAVAAAYGISYEALSGILSDVNYSSARMGWLEFHRNVGRWRHGIMIPQALQRVARWFDDAMGVASGARARAEWTWTPPRREMLDPQKDVPALVDAIRAGMMTLSEVQRSLGYVPQEVIAELSEDLQAAKDAGLVLSVDPSEDSARINAQRRVIAEAASDSADEMA